MAESGLSACGVCVSGLVCGRFVCGLRGSEAPPGYVCDGRFGKGEGAAALGRARLDGEGLCSRTAHHLLSARLPRRRCCGLRRSAEVSNTRRRRRRASVRGVAAALERVSHTDEACASKRCLRHARRFFDKALIFFS